MRRHMVCAVGLLAAFVVNPIAAVAQGQGGRGGGMGMGGPVLIGMGPVQTELKMSDEQIKKAQSFAQEYGEKSREAMSQFSDLTGDERMTKMQAVNQTMSAAGMKEVEAMLKPEQTKRFKEIVFQQRGINNFTDPETAKTFKITSVQADRIKNLMDNQRGELREAQQSSAGDRQVMMEKTQAIRKETTAKVMALMTPEQTTMYKEMSGETFTMPSMGGRGNR